MTKARDLANAADALDDVSATELGYVNGVTSAIQTQLNNKQAVVSGVDDTEIGYLNGVTSSIQTQLDSKIAKSLVDAKADIITATADNTPARLAVGSNDQVLTADSSTATGLKWATPSSGGMTLLSTTTPSGTITNIDSISQSYTDLVIYMSNLTTSATAAYNFRIRAASSNLTAYYIGTSQSNGTIGNGADQSASILVDQNSTNIKNTIAENSVVVTINNYSSTTLRKSFQWYGGFYNHNDSYVKTMGAGYLISTSAIDGFGVAFGTATGGTIQIYGVK